MAIETITWPDRVDSDTPTGAVGRWEAAHCNEAKFAVNENAAVLSQVFAAALRASTQSLSLTTSPVSPDIESGSTIVLTAPSSAGPPSVTVFLVPPPANMEVGDRVTVVVRNDSGYSLDIDWDTGVENASGGALATDTVADAARLVRQFVALSTSVMREL